MPRDRSTVLMGWRDDEDTSASSVLPVVNRKASQVKEVLPEPVHWSKKRLDEMTERDWRIFKEDLGISLLGAPHQMPPMLRSWQDAQPILGQRILRLVDQAGYREPTAVQRVAIPLLTKCHDRDLIALAETGSGKTAAFLLPILRRILLIEDAIADERERNSKNYRLEEEQKTLFALILVPTRELALQIEQEAEKFAKPLGIGVMAIVGGQSIAHQSVRVMRGVRLIVATPGRLRDCLEQRVISVEGLQTIVLDEADRMIDLNYEEDLQWILSQADAKVQRLMFSATMPGPVERLAQAYLTSDPVRLSIGQAGKVVERVEQRLVWCEDETEKGRRLFDALKLINLDDADGPVLIFVNQKSTVDAVVNRLQAHGYRAVGLHGGRTQGQREQAMGSVRSGKQDILVATDVAGRGVDIPLIPLVINYDMSRSIEDYVHRVGRTGRAGAQGLSVTFLTEADAPLFWSLKQLLLKSPAGMNGVPSAFSQHPATKTPPGQEIPRKRKDDRVYAYGLQ